MAEEFQFIRLFFPAAVQQEVALRVLRALTGPLGEQAAQIRPETRLQEIMAWADVEGVDAVEFIATFEDGIGMEVDLLAADFERMTFREVVENVCEKEQGAS